MNEILQFYSILIGIIFTIIMVTVLVLNSKKKNNPHNKMLDRCLDRFKNYDDKFKEINSAIKSKLMIIGLEIKEIRTDLRSYRDEVANMKGDSDVYKIRNEEEKKRIKEKLDYLEKKGK